ncbi:MAG: histidine kinase [Ruminococcus sp.]|nr:histidine kinase [Ruminococcus sp.]
MMDWSTVFNLTSILTTLLIGFIAIVVALVLRDIEKWWRRYCIVFFSVIVARNLFDLFDYFFLNITTVETICGFLNTLLATIINPLLALYILHRSSENIRRSLYWKLSLILWGLQTTLLIFGTLTGTFYTISESIEDIRFGFTFYAYLMVGAVALAVNLIALIRRRKHLSKPQFFIILLYYFVPNSIMVLLMELMMLLDQGKRYLTQKEELSRQKVSNAVLQMRPHFIYNTMTSIYYLIEQDSAKAQQVTRDFTNYLRKNFTAIAKEGTVPFAEELEHTEAYLSVELARFEGKLFVDYDISYMSFRLPPLVLQPIVENAVKHGVDPDLDPLYITVSACEGKHGAEITVTDNGPGFGEQDNDEPHIALQNIRERLEMMCKGTLEISDRDGGGTVVKITIPQ